MIDFTIDSVDSIGDDVLRVTARTSTGDTVEALGWVSATTNHYDAADYLETWYDDNAGQWKPVNASTPDDVLRDVHRRDGAKPRAMTAAEVGEYARRLVLEQHQELVEAPAAMEATPINFEAS